MMDPQDWVAIRAAGAWISPDDVEALRTAARAASATFEDLARELMTVARAYVIKSWRVDEDYTWRAVARAAHAEWGNLWEPAANQLMGRALCERAAIVLGESPTEEPWN